MDTSKRLSPDREKRYPALFSTGYEVTSLETVDYRRPVYNCIAFAADDETQWWWPDEHGESYWPEVERKVHRSSFIEAFRTLGYEVCAHGKLEERYEKIVFYEKDGVPTHAAKQTLSGTWKSKLGEWEDIEHATVQAVQTVNRIGRYGEAAIYMRRPRTCQNQNRLKTLFSRFLATFRKQ